MAALWGGRQLKKKSLSRRDRRVEQRPAFIFGLMLATSLVNTPVNAMEALQRTVWDYDHGFGCLTTITFLTNDSYMLESAGQVIMKNYEVEQHEDTEFFLLSQRTIANNDQASCAGIRAGRVGSRQKAYFKLSEDGDSLTFFPKPDNESTVRVVYTKRQTE